MSDIQGELQKVKKICESLDGIKEQIEKVDQDVIRTYIKYNERLSHCEDESFNVRSTLEELSGFCDGELKENTDYLIEELEVFLGED